MFWNDRASGDETTGFLRSTRVIAAITEPTIASRILKCMDLPPYDRARSKRSSQSSFRR